MKKYVLLSLGILFAISQGVLAEAEANITVPGDNKLICQPVEKQDNNHPTNKQEMSQQEKNSQAKHGPICLPPKCGAGQ